MSINKHFAIHNFGRPSLRLGTIQSTAARLADE